MNALKEQDAQRQLSVSNVKEPHTLQDTAIASPASLVMRTLPFIFVEPNDSNADIAFRLLSAPGPKDETRRTRRQK